MDVIDLDPYDMALARAAIEAMREPTKEMGEAGFETLKWGESPSDVVWQAMIDAALKEKDPTP
jgi:hypothetical protein